MSEPVDVVAKGRKVAEWLKSCKIIFEPYGNGEKVEALCAEVERLQAETKRQDEWISKLADECHKYYLEIEIMKAVKRGEA